MSDERTEGILLHGEFYTSSQVADQLGVSTNPVRALSREKDLGIRLGRDRLYTKTDIDAMRTRRPRGRPKKEADAGAIGRE